MDGILAIDKPAGMTSHDVVARVRRLCGQKRVGHAGTLDPDATGVLVVALGQATRLLPHLETEPKIYRAVACFGRATTTEDASGETTEEADASLLTTERLAGVLPLFRGPIAQVPPMVSALHHQGQRLYDLARKGITVEREARTVVIHSLALLDFAPGPRAQATLRVACGGGTYIRTLCKDIGAAVGLPAHMAALVREAVGPFALADALPLDERLASARVLPMHEALGWPTRTLTDDEAVRIRRGQTIAADTPEGERRALLHAGALLALARSQGGCLHPFTVFAS